MRIPDHFIRVIPLPRRVRGVTVPNDDGTFSIYINALYGDSDRRRTLEHELEHLARDHFYAAAPIAAQEAEANGAPVPGEGNVPSAPRRIRAYRGTAGLEKYLRSIGALENTIEQLGKPW